jgi:hypothetical protein
MLRAGEGVRLGRVLLHGGTDARDRVDESAVTGTAE